MHLISDLGRRTDLFGDHSELVSRRQYEAGSLVQPAVEPDGRPVRRHLSDGAAAALRRRHVQMGPLSHLLQQHVLVGAVPPVIIAANDTLTPWCISVSVCLSTAAL